MSATLQNSRVVILVKAVPNPSRKYGETVCCAGVTADGQWKRLFPIRFRHLKERRFNRWDWVEFQHNAPKGDNRPESCHVWEDRLNVTGTLKSAERAALLAPLIVPSTAHAASRGHSLALIRPSKTRFVVRKKPGSIIEAERARYARAARQLSFLDEELTAIEPSPYLFGFAFQDAAGKHFNACGDWETAATFWKLRQSHGEEVALRHLKTQYDEVYPAKGMAFAMGTVRARPRQWLLLGVLRLDELSENQTAQGSLPF